MAVASKPSVCPTWKRPAGYAVTRVTVGAVLVPVTVTVTDFASVAPLESVARTPTVLVPAVAYVAPCVGPVPSSYCPSLSRSQA